MSTLKVDNIRDNGTGFNDVVSFQNANGTENGRLCRAFVNFNGKGGVAIRSNFNVNSVGDNGDGDYTVYFANAMSNANYALAGFASNNDNGNGETFTVSRKEDDTFTTSACEISIAENTGGSTLQLDSGLITVIFFS